VTWSEFSTELAAFLHTDGTRRGIEAFRAAQVRAALADLGAYIDEYATGTLTYANGDHTPFDTETAEAVADFVRSRIARSISNDPALSQSYYGSYLNLRRRLFLRIKENRYPELRPYVGKPFVLAVTVKRNHAPMPLDGEVWFTVKQFAGEADSEAVIQLNRASGLDVTNPAQGKVTLILSADDTAKLIPGERYVWEFQVIDEAGHAIIPDNLSGSMLPRQPVTIQ